MSKIIELPNDTKVIAGHLMRELSDRNLTFGEALNALLLATIVSAQEGGFDKEGILNNISENWDLCEVQYEELKH